MGSSAKKRKEKKKDFQKTKLKVGKTKPKADNATDTSFKARSLVLNHQSINVAAPTTAALFSHHISILKGGNDRQRQESLAHLTSTIAAWPKGQALPEPMTTLLPKLQSLALNPSHGVQQQFLRLLRTLPKKEIRLHASQLLLYTRAAMTHLSADVKLFAMDLLEWLLGTAGQETVSCPGGWMKTLATFVNLLGWEKLQRKGPVEGWRGGLQPSTRPGAGGKLQARQMTVLALLLLVGLSAPRPPATAQAISTFPVWNPSQNDLPQRSDPYAGLGLFGSNKENEEVAMLEDRQDRQSLFANRFQESIEGGIDMTRKEGGEIGRASAALRKTVTSGMTDYDAT